MWPNLFLKTLRDMRGSLLWGVGMVVVSLWVVHLFSSFRNDETMQALDSFVKVLPPTLRGAWVMGIPDVTTFEGFARLQFLNYLPVLLSVVAIIEGSAGIASEEERRTIDLLMAQPIARWRVVVEKFAALVVVTYVIAALAGLGLVLGTRFVAVGLPWYRMLLAGTKAVPPALVVGALSLLVSAAMRRRRRAVIAGCVFVTASFFLNVFGLIAGPLKPWRHLSVFYPYSVNDPFASEVVTDAAIWLYAIAIVLLAVAVFAFKRKELGL